MGKTQLYPICFNPRAHVGRDCLRVSAPYAPPCFNPRAHVGRDIRCCCSRSTNLRFQSTRPRGARRYNRHSGDCYLFGFNPRAHVGRDSRFRASSVHRQRFQSTRPRGARLCHDAGCTITYGFNPRAHVGRDILSVNVSKTINSFNPRAHVGRDQLARFGHVQEGVSIHAPTWGATTQCCTCCKIRRVSIHAPTWGATRPAPPQQHPYALFQSTRPRGARHPRLRLTLNGQVVSIHAPTWGATAARDLQVLNGSNVSIHAPTWGATNCWSLPVSYGTCFNPRAHVGRDTNQKHVLHKSKFQSTRPRGARLL